MCLFTLSRASRGEENSTKRYYIHSKLIFCNSWKQKTRARVRELGDMQVHAREHVEVKVEKSNNMHIYMHIIAKPGILCFQHTRA